MAGAVRVVDGLVLTLIEELLAEASRDPRRAALARLRHATGHVAVNSGPVIDLLGGLGLPVSEPEIADPILLAAGEAGSLWRLPRDDDHDAITTPLGAEGRRGWDRARRVAERFVPVVAGDLGPDDAPSGLVRLWPGAEPFVDGASFGAAFLLAQASLRMWMPLDAGVAASAEVQADGSITGVSGLDKKIAALRDWAPGVTRLIVAADQLKEATALLEGTGVKPVPASDALDVMTAGFDHMQYLGALRDRWDANPGHAERLAQRLFRQVATEPRSHSNWAAVAMTARLIERHPVSETAQWHAAVVSVIADRHCGKDALRLPVRPESVRRPPRPHRLALLAHEVQAATDRCDPDWKDLVAEAEAEVHGDDSPEDLQLLGAIGRAYASWSCWDDARQALRSAIAGWEALHRPHHASFAGCALLRVEGLAGDVASVEDVCRLLAECLASPETSEVSRAHLALAEGRAWATLGLRDRALAAFGRASAEALLDDRTVAASIARWRRRAGDKSADMSGFGMGEATGFAVILARADEGDLGAIAEFGKVDAREWVRAGGGVDVERGLRGFVY